MERKERNDDKGHTNPANYPERDPLTGRWTGMAKYAKKKRCPRCGKTKWKYEFYKFHSTRAHGALVYSTYCRECEAEISIERYQPRKESTRLCRDGRIRHIKPLGGERGKPHGCSAALAWSQAKLETMRREFPTTTNEDLAIDLGVSQRTLIRKARELGLEKDPNWLREKALEGCRKMQLINKSCRNTGMFKRGVRNSPNTEFKPGQKPQRKTYKDQNQTTKRSE